MHRTVKGTYLFYRYAEVNGTKKNRCVQVKKSLTDSKRTGQGQFSLLGSQILSIGVFSNDFAAVDVREDLCKTKPPEKANSEGLLQLDNNSEEIAGKK